MDPKEHVLGGALWKIWRIQIEIYPQSYIEPNHSAYNLKNKVCVRGLVRGVYLFPDRGVLAEKDSFPLQRSPNLRHLHLLTTWDFHSS